MKKVKVTAKKYFEGYICNSIIKENRKSCTEKEINPMKHIKVTGKRVKKYNKIKVNAYNNSILKKLIDGTDFNSPIEYINNAVKAISNVWAVCLTYDENLIELQEVYDSLVNTKIYDINYLLKVCITTGQGKLKALGILKQTNIILQRMGYILRLLNKKGVDTSYIKYNSSELYHAMFYNSMIDKTSVNFIKKSPYDINDIIVRHGNKILNISLKHSNSANKINNDAFIQINNALESTGLDCLGTYIMIPMGANKYINIPYLNFNKLLSLKEVTIKIDIADMEMCEILMSFNQTTNNILNLLYIIEDYSSIERFLYMNDHCNVQYYGFSMFIKNAEVSYKIKDKNITTSYSEFIDKYFRFMED